MFYSCCIVYCLQSEENRTPFERQPWQPIMEVWSYGAAVCLREKPFVALSFKEMRSPRFSCLRGDSVVVSPNWLRLSLHERWRAAEEEEVEKTKRKGPKGISRWEQQCIKCVYRATMITSDVKFNCVDSKKQESKLAHFSRSSFTAVLAAFTAA